MHLPDRSSTGSSGTLRGLTLGFLLILALTGCGVRLDLPPAPAPVPEGQDAVRQEAAQRVSAIADSARTAAQDAPEPVGVALQAVADDARAHLDALGGVWEPPPRPEPDSEDDADGDDGDAAAEPEPVTDPGPVDVLAELESSATQLPADATGVDADLATMLVSISVNQHLHARDLRTALDLEPIDPPQAPADPFPAEFEPEAATVVRILDAGGYVAEVHAGRTSGEQSAILADRARDLRAQAELVASRAGFAGTAEDPREPVYALDLEDLPGQAQDLTRALVPAWLDLFGPAQEGDRDLIGIQVLRTALAGYGPGEPVPTFPGRAG